jgi:hypothetical protein
MFVSKERTVAGIPLVLGIKLVHVHVRTISIVPHVHVAKLAFCDKTIYDTGV